MSVAQSVGYAWRSLRRTPVFTIAASLMLVIGIGACVAIFAVLNGVLLRPLPYGHPDRLVGAWHDLTSLSMKKANQTQGTYFIYKRFARTIENIGVYQEGAVNLAETGGSGEPQRASSAWITASLIPTLQVTPILGRIFTEAEDVPNGPWLVILGEGLWRSRFGADPGIVGRSIDVNGRSRQVVGVMPESFRFPAAETQLWLPLQLDPAAAYSSGFNYNAVARLRPGVSVAQAERDFATVLPRIVDIYPDLAPGITTQMLLDQAKPIPVLSPLREDVTGGIYRTLWMVAAAAVLVLLVACANVANLMLVRADARQRELAVREALGAGRARVLFHFFSESVIIAGIAGTLGIMAAWAAVRALVAAGPTEVPRLAEVRIDTTTVLVAIAIAALTAVVCAVVPALRIGRARLADALRAGGGTRGGTSGRAQQRLRGAMVAVQMALALVALAGSGLLLRSFQELNRVKPGFNPENVATFWMSLPSARYRNDSALVQFYSRLLPRVSQLPGITSASLTSRLPLMRFGLNQNPFYIEGDDTYATKIPPLQIFSVTDGGYFQTMGIPLLAGRTFEPIGTQRGYDAIISQRTAEQFWKDPTGRAALGKRFRMLPGTPWLTVVGVVGNVRDTTLAAPPSQRVYTAMAAERDTLASQGQRTMALVVKTSIEPTSVTRAVQGVIRELDPTLPTFDVKPMSLVMRASMAQLSFTTVILGAAAVVSLLLGAMGLYGVMAYLVTLRTREVGVRIALGAQPRAVASMMTRQGLVLAAVGVVVGVVMFAIIARFLQSFLFGVTPTDPLTIAGAAVVLMAIAAFASWIPARRAAWVDPASTLRAE